MALGILVGFLRGGRAVPKTGISALTSKRGPRNFYKGKGCKSTGRHTSKGLFLSLGSDFILWHKICLETFHDFVGLLCIYTGIVPESKVDNCAWELISWHFVILGACFCFSCTHTFSHTHVRGNCSEKAVVFKRGPTLSRWLQFCCRWTFGPLRINCCIWSLPLGSSLCLKTPQTLHASERKFNETLLKTLNTWRVVIAGQSYRMSFRYSGARYDCCT